MKLEFEYGHGLMSANLPDNTDVFIPGVTVPDPDCLPQDWDSLYAATLESIRNPYGMPALKELAAPGKTPAGKEYITKIARFVKEVTGGIDVVYGGGLKVDNAEMLASIEEIDGGLIALTRFQGEIGFYPDEYIEIIRTYLGQ